MDPNTTVAPINPPVQVQNGREAIWFQVGKGALTAKALASKQTPPTKKEINAARTGLLIYLASSKLIPT